MAHRCPTRCHRCPELSGEVMPSCMGTAAMGSIDPTQLNWCTCTRPGRGEPTLEDQVRALNKRVAELERVTMPATPKVRSSRNA